ncbi:hypothetical protein [Mycetocola zhujimingii]|uniref:hypothetical protein n=1 Tax=Mycetocola zhujimingii TaxID=2079792 RepID=UPI000D338DDB|nr:hypothetical protein [Mycetocola zhujimingii]AWB87724.1 hypothetical protein C3E77_14695 [Mycetocola zhujimingii]
MTQAEYETNLDQNSDQKPHEGTTEQAATGTAATDAEALALDHKRALDEEAIEAEHLDYFMEHVSGQG